MSNFERMARRLAALSLAALAIAAVSASTALAAVDIYIGPTVDGYWSTSTNWSLPVPPTPVGCDVTFNSAAGLGTINYAEDNVTSPGNLISIGPINSLWYAQNDTGQIHTTQIDAGCTLKVQGVNPTPAPGFAATEFFSLFAGNVGAAQTSVLKTVIQGYGALDVSNANNENTTGDIIVAMGNANAGTTYPDHTAILDMSGLSMFNANVDQLLVGVEGSGSGLDRPNGLMYLAKNNTIVLNNALSPAAAAGGTSCPLPGGALIVGYTSNKGAGDAYVCGLYLGHTNAIHADYVLVGGRLRPGAMGWESTTDGSSMQLRGTSQPRVKQFLIGDETNNSTGGNPTIGTVDLRGGSVDIMADAIIVGQSTTNYVGVNTRNGYRGTGTLSFDAGTVDTTGMSIANQATDLNSSATGTVNVGGTAILTVGASGLAMSNYAGNTNFGQQATAASTLNVSGGTVTVGANISMNTLAAGNGPTTGRSVASTINITGGSVTVNGNIVKGLLTTSNGGTDTATVTLNGGTLDMASNSIGTVSAVRQPEFPERNP